MAVGRGSMERAAKAAGADASARKPANKPAGNKKEVSVKTTVKSETVAAEKNTDGQIVYQKSSGMLERAAMPNEKFGLGDAMPVYYF